MKTNVVSFKHHGGRKLFCFVKGLLKYINLHFCIIRIQTKHQPIHYMSNVGSRSFSRSFSQMCCTATEIESSGSVVECATRDYMFLIRASSEALCCIIEQNTISPAQYWFDIVNIPRPDMTAKLFTGM